MLDTPAVIVVRGGWSQRPETLSVTRILAEILMIFILFKIINKFIDWSNFICPENY